MRWWSVGLLFGGVGVAALGVFASASCGATPGPSGGEATPTPADPGSDATCNATWPAWQPDDKAPDVGPVPESKLVLTGRIPLSRIADEIAGQVPTVVASGRRKPIGAPGRATYRVTRGGFTAKLSGSDLVVSTPLSVHAEVCKPIGPMCPTYASCDPELLATARVPLVLGPKLGVGKSRVGVAVTRPCAIAGVDVTSKMMKVASRQTSNVERQIDRSIPALAKPAAEAWRRMHTTVRLDDGACLRVDPTTWSQATPVAKDEVLSVRVGLTGTLEVLGDCSDRGAPDEAPPELTRVEELPERGAVHVAVRGEPQFERKVVDALRALPSVVDARVRSGGVDGRGVLALGLTVRGAACGETWIFSALEWDGGTSAVRFSEPRPYPGQSADASRAARALVASAELQGIRVPLKRVTEVQSALRAQLELFAAVELEEAELALDISEPRVESVAVDVDGIRATLTASSKIELSVR